MLYAIKLFIPLNLLFFSGEFITHVNGSGWLHQVIRFLSSWKSQTEKQSWLMGTSNIAPKIQTFTKNEIDTLPWSILSHSVELLHLSVVYQWQKLLHQISQSTRTFKTKAVQWYSKSSYSKFYSTAKLLYVAVRLYVNRSQMTSKCGITKKCHTRLSQECYWMLSPHFDIFWDLFLNSLTATWDLFDLYNKKHLYCLWCQQFFPMYKAVQLFSLQVTEQINLNRIVQDIYILTREKYDLACPKKWAINHFFSGIWTQKKNYIFHICCPNTCRLRACYFVKQRIAIYFKANPISHLVVVIRFFPTNKLIMIQTGKVNKWV